MARDIESQVATMINQIKEMEPVLGRDRCKSFTIDTLKKQVKKKVITEDEYHDVLKRLDYE